MASPRQIRQPLRAWPFLGRQDELEWAAELVRDDASSGIVIAGQAGVGKTRFAREVLAAAAEGGAPTEWVQATVAAASIPLGAFAALVPTETRTNSRLELFQLCAAALRERAGPARLLLVVDDAHVLDAASAALVLHLATTGAAFVVVTVRAGEPCPDPIVALWKDLDTPRLELQLLSESETGAVLDAVLGDEVAPAAKHWAYGATEGHMLYLRELVNEALASGALTNDDGTWSLRSKPGPSPALVDLISGALGELTEAELDAARTLALGEPLELEVLTEIVALPRLAGLEQRGLAHVVMPSTSTERKEVRLGHPLYGEVLRAGIPALRGLELRTRLAEATRAHGLERPGDALRVAMWMDDAGAELDDPLLVAAARDALRAGEAPLAEELAARASPGHEASLVLAGACLQERRFEEAETVLGELDVRTLPRELAAEYLGVRALWVLHVGLHRSDEALGLLGSARALFDDGAWGRQVAALWHLICLSGAGEGPSAAADGMAQLLAHGDLEPGLRRLVSVGHMSALRRAGRINEAVAVSASLRPALPLRDVADVWALTVWCVVRRETGHEWPELEKWLQEADGATAPADPLTRGEIAAIAAEVALDRGQGITAARRAREAIEILERFDTSSRLPSALLVLATSAAQTGEVETSRTALADYAVAIGDAPRPYWRHYREEVCSIAALALAEGRSADATTLLIDAARPDVRALDRARLLYEALRAGSPPETVAEALREAADASEAPLARLFADQAAAQAKGDARALLEVARQYGELGLWLWAAESSALAARSFEREGREDSARRASQQGARFLAKCEEIRSPVLSDVALAPAELTQREREIVALAAQGASNAEIAERLVLSVRTVESHLYRAMRKLGTSSRQELSSLDDAAHIQRPQEAAERRDHSSVVP